MLSLMGQFWCGMLSALVNHVLRPPTSQSLFCCFFFLLLRFILINLASGLLYLYPKAINENKE